MVDPTSPFSADLQIRNIIDTAMDGIISMNEEQKIVLFNAAAEEIFGYRAEQVPGQSIAMLIPSRFRPQHRHDVEQFGRGVIQSQRMGTQRTVLRASGEEFPIEPSISQTTVYVVCLPARRVTALRNCEMLASRPGMRTCLMATIH